MPREKQGGGCQASTNFIISVSRIFATRNGLALTTSDLFSVFLRHGGMQKMLSNYGKKRLRKSEDALDAMKKMDRATCNGIPICATYVRPNNHSGRLASKPAFGRPLHFAAS
jgi:hypothetical protein